MEQGDKYTCDCCGAILVVEVPCTCEDRDDAPSCFCGESMMPIGEDEIDIEAE